MKNQKGFTLVELLAVMVILGIIMAVAIPNVTGILYKNRSSTYVEDAKKLATTAEYKLRGSSSDIVKPSNGQCIVMNLAYLDNSEFEEPPNGGEYLKNQSFVIIKKNGNSYEYYVQLVEKIKDGVDGRGIPLINAQALNADTATDEVANISLADLFNVSDYAFVYGEDANNATKGTNFKSKIKNDIPNCSSVNYIYATE